MDFGRGCMTQMVTEESLRKTSDFYPDQDTSLEKKKVKCQHVFSWRLYCSKYIVFANINAIIIILISSTIIHIYSFSSLAFISANIDRRTCIINFISRLYLELLFHAKLVLGWSVNTSIHLLSHSPCNYCHHPVNFKLLLYMEFEAGYRVRHH